MFFYPSTGIHIKLSWCFGTVMAVALPTLITVGIFMILRTEALKHFKTQRLPDYPVASCAKGKNMRDHGNDQHQFPTPDSIDHSCAETAIVDNDPPGTDQPPEAQHIARNTILTADYVPYNANGSVIQQTVMISNR